jgi:ABC-type glycerol-3-phosphate transport system permease component
MLKIAQNFISHHIIISILTLVILVVIAYAFEKVVGNRRNENLRRIEPFLDWMPFMVGLIPLAGLFREVFNLYRAVTIPHTGTGDPIVISYALSETYTHIAILCGLFFILFEASFILRMLYGRYKREIDAYKT